MTITGIPIPSATTTTPLPAPIHGQGDWRVYRAVKLANGVTVCVVQDKESKTTAVAATVTAGACSDPRSFNGLAHFLEHMCFLGSEKYPLENEYKRYLSQHGGQSNASTSLFLTTFKFDILAPHAEQAIDIFSQFFVSPLFTASGTEREIHAVDSENSKNLTSDLRRRLQVLKDVCRPEHYFTKFSTGNLATLLKQDESQMAEQQVDVLRQSLLCFHAHHYKSDRLTVVSVGPQSVEQLLEWIVPRFADMKNRVLLPTGNSIDPYVQQLIETAAEEAPPFGYPPATLPFRNPLGDSATKALITTKPVKSQRRLVLVFPLPPTTDTDRSPVSVLSHLLGHEGPHSSFAVLQDREWITSLSAGPRMTAPDFTLFQVDIQLTPLGEDEWKQVAAVVLQHAQMIHDQAKTEAQQSGQSRRLHEIWGESATLSQIFFHQTSPSSAYDFAPSLCRRIVLEGTEKCLSAGSLLDEGVDTLPVNEVVDFASRLTIDNCLMERCSQAAWDEMEKRESDSLSSGVSVRKTERWYGVDYFYTALDEDDIKGWKEPGFKFLDATELLALPRPNRYIPRSLELCPDLPEDAKVGPRIEKDIDPPNLLVSNDVGRLWHRLDDRYALPKSVVTFLIRNAAVENVKEGVDPSSGAIKWKYEDRSVVLSSLMSSIYAQSQAQETYDANLAGLHWSLSLNSSGILVSCSGFSDRLPDLALKILEDFMSGDFLQESYFKASRDRIVRGLRTFLESRRADSDAMYYRDLFLTANGRGVDFSLEAAEAATLEVVKEHHRALLENEESVVECLFSGNISAKDAFNFFDSASSVFSTSCARPSNRLKQGVWIPGDVERRLASSEDVEFHFSSRNPQEENGAVLVTYQSHIPGYRGDKLSTQESLQSTAAIRLLSHMLREPLFYELRTQQTLGYVVSSYYDVAVTARSSQDAALGPLRVPVDFLVINILSRKLPPPEVCSRIDDFLVRFRQTLLNMPDSQIQHHASALSTKLLKPIQKLGTEAATHFSKISRYSPEVLDQGGLDQDLPWNSVQTLALTIGDLKRHDLIRSWDRLMLPGSRARLVSCVYGTTFPLQADHLLRSRSRSRCKLLVVNDHARVVASRSSFPVFDNTPSVRLSRSTTGVLWSRLLPALVATNSPTALRVATAVVVGAGITAAVGWTMLRNSKKTSK